MKKSIQPIIIAILLIFIWFKGCVDRKQDSNSIKVTIPEVKGNFEPVKPNKGKEINQAYIDSIKSTVKQSSSNKNKDKYISDILDLYNENEALKQQFLNETDSLKRELMYLKAIKLNEYYQEFDDEYLNAMIKIISPGDVKLVSMNYKIKEREHKLNIPDVKFRLIAGGSFGNSTDFNNPLFSAGIGFQNKKGGILLGSFDTEKQITIGYYQSIFSIKK